MQFGHIYDNVNDIDFRLPPDGEVTAATLNRVTREPAIPVYVGGAKWADKSWLGKVYPNGTKETDFLKSYADSFNAIEFGPTFYNIYSHEELTQWKNKVSDSPGFKFCPKFPQSITHIRRLTNAEEATRAFYASLKAFENNLGTLLLQLSDNFSPKSYPQLEAYLTALPTTYKVAVEVRHKDWYAIPYHRKKLFELLKKVNIGSVISDTPGRRDCIHMELPTPHAFIRLVGCNLDKTDYTRIDEWVGRLKQWRDGGLESVYFFVHQHTEKLVPDLCDYLIVTLNRELALNIKRPTLFQSGT